MRGKCIACDEDWRAWADTCFRFTKTLMNWHEAKGFCAERRADLMTLETEAKFLFIKDVFEIDTNSERAWLNSITDTPLIFKWTNDQIIANSFYGASNPDNRDGLNELCIEMSRADNFKLNDSNCGKLNDLFCEYHD